MAATRIGLAATRAGLAATGIGLATIAVDLLIPRGGTDGVGGTWATAGGGTVRPVAAEITSATCPATFTLRHSPMIVPSGPIRKVVRSMPGKVRP